MSFFDLGRGALRGLADFLFGFDFFVSYAHLDGRNYPERLAEALERLGYKVCLDRQQYQAGEVLSLLTRRFVRNSNTLLVVARPRALLSPWVLRELQECLDAGRTPVAIDVNGTLSGEAGENPVKQLLEGRLYVPELIPDADGNPSDVVVHRLQQRFVGVRQETFRLRLIAGTAVTFAVIAGLATWQWREAVYQRDQAALRLVSQRVNNGTRAAIDGDLWGAWSWYANALMLAHVAGLDGRAHRERLHGLRPLLPHLQQLWSPPESTRAAAIAPDAGRVALYVRDERVSIAQPRAGRIEVRNVADGSRVAEVAVGSSYLRAMAFSPDGDELWTIRSETVPASKRKRLIAAIHAVLTGTLRASLEVDEDHPRLDWLDDRTLAVVDSKAARVLRFRGGTVDADTLDGPADADCSIQAVSKDAGLLAIYSDKKKQLFVRRGKPPTEVYALDCDHSPTVAFSPDGKSLVTVVIKDLVIWRLEETARKVGEAKLGGFVKAMRFHRAGGLMITEEREDHALVTTLWNLGDASLMKTFDHEKIVARWEFPPDVRDSSGAAAATGMGMKAINPFERMTMMSEDGSRLLTVSQRTRSYRIWDVETGEALTPPLSHGGAELRSVRFSADGRGAVSTADDGLTRAWDVALPRRDKPLIGQPGPVTFLTFVGSAGRLLSLSGGRAHVFDWNRGKEDASLGEDLDAMRVAAGGRALAGRRSDAFRLWDAETLAPMTPWLPHPSIDGLSVSERGRYAATWDRDYQKSARVRLWDLHAGTMLAELNPGPSHLSGVEIDEGCGIAVLVVPAAEGGGHDVLVVDLLGRTTGRATCVLHLSFEGLFRSERAAGPIAFDGRSFWRIGRPAHAGPRALATNRSALTRFAAAAPDGTKVVLTDRDRQIAQVVDVATGSPLTPEFRHEWPITDSEISPDGTRMLTVSGNRVHLWDLATGEAIVPVIRYPDTVTAAAFHPKGRAFVVSAKQDVGDDGFALFIELLGQEAAPVEDLVAYGDVNGWQRVDAVGARLPLSAGELARIWGSLSRSGSAVGQAPGSPLDWYRQLKAEGGRYSQPRLHYLDRILELDPDDRAARFERAGLRGGRGDYAAFLADLDALWKVTPTTGTIPLDEGQVRQWSDWLLALDRPGDALRIMSSPGASREGLDGWRYGLASFGAHDLGAYARNADEMLRRAAEIARGDGPWQGKWNAAYYAALASLLADETKAQFHAAVELASAASNTPETARALQMLKGADALKADDLAAAGSILDGLRADDLLIQALLADLRLRQGDRGGARSLVTELNADLGKFKPDDGNILGITQIRYLLRSLEATLRTR